MPAITSSFFELLSRFRCTFSGPVFRNFEILAIGAVLNHGRQTICGVLRIYPGSVEKHWSCFHRFLSTVHWSPLALSKQLCSLILDSIPSSNEVILIADDTLIRRWGKKVSRISVHRDPIRSGKSGKKTVYARGHEWMVISIAFKTRHRSQPWALPVFVFPEIPQKVLDSEHEENGKRCGQYRSPTQLIILALRLLRRWFPTRRFLLLADGSLNTHELHRFVANDAQLDVIGHFRKDSVLHATPPKHPTGKRGRPRKIGIRLPSPAEAAAMEKAAWEKKNCHWYGNTEKTQWLLSDTACWYRPGKSVPRIRWVVVRDPDAKNKDNVLCTSRLGMLSDEIVSSYVIRWSIETTFEESRKHLHVETTENWSRKAIQRTIPLLFGLFSLIVLWYAEQRKKPFMRHDAWYAKNEPSFSDAITQLRTELWMKSIFPESKSPRGFLKNKKELLKFIISKAA